VCVVQSANRKQEALGGIHRRVSYRCTYWEHTLEPRQLECRKKQSLPLQSLSSCAARSIGGVQTGPGKRRPRNSSAKTIRVSAAKPPAYSLTARSMATARTADQRNCLRTRHGLFSSARNQPSLSQRAPSFDLNQLDRFAARAFDHDGARFSELIRPAQTFDPLAAIAEFGLLTEKLHAFAPQFRNPGIEVGDAESKMIRQVAPSAREWSVVLPCVPTRMGSISLLGDSRGSALVQFPAQLDASRSDVL